MLIERDSAAQYYAGIQTRTTTGPTYSNSIKLIQLGSGSGEGCGGFTIGFQPESAPSANQIRIDYGNYYDSYTYFNVVGDNIPLSTPTMLCVSYDSIAEKLRLYTFHTGSKRYDSGLVDCANPRYNYEDRHGLTIMASGSQSGDYMMPCKIGNFGIWHRALSESDFTSIFNAGTMKRFSTL